MEQTQTTILDDEVEKAIDEYNARLRELHTEISDLRKEGKDPIIADSLLRSVASKIQWAKITKNVDDFKKIEDILDYAKQEINEASKKTVINVKKEIEERVKGEFKREEEIRNQQLTAEQAEKKSVIDELEQTRREEEKIKQQQKTMQIMEESRIKQEQELRRKEEMRKHMKIREYEKILGIPKNYFYLHCGKVVRSLNGLIMILPKIDDACFIFHTKEHGNDFSRWIQGVFQDYQLAKKIKVASTKEELKTILDRDRRGE